MFRWLMLHGDMFPCLHFVLEADCKSAKDSSMNWLFPKVNPIEGQIEGQKSASCTAKLVRYIFYARSRAWQRLLAHSSQVFDDTSMDMMEKASIFLDVEKSHLSCHLCIIHFPPELHLKSRSHLLPGSYGEGGLMLQLARMQGCSYLGYIHPI